MPIFTARERFFYFAGVNCFQVGNGCYHSRRCEAGRRRLLLGENRWIAGGVMRFGVNWQFWEGHSHFVAALVRGLQILGAGRHFGGFPGRAFHFSLVETDSNRSPGLPIL
jgi:hypothetical protein